MQNNWCGLRIPKCGKQFLSQRHSRDFRFDAVFCHVFSFSAAHASRLVVRLVDGSRHVLHFAKMFARFSSKRCPVTICHCSSLLPLNLGDPCVSVPAGQTSWRFCARSRHPPNHHPSYLDPAKLSRLCPHAVCANRSASHTAELCHIHNLLCTVLCCAIHLAPDAHTL